MDLNPEHFGEDKKPHPAYITARYGHKYKGNSITHSKFTTDGFKTHKITENPNKLSQDKRQTRISPPFWQSDKLFSENKLENFRFSQNTRIVIKKINKKYK